MYRRYAHVGYIAACCAVVIALAAFCTRSAVISSTLRVTGTSATLSADGQTVTAAWPPGITHAAASTSPSYARLFAFDGTDSAGTGSEDPQALQQDMSSPYFRFICWMRDCAGYSQWQHVTLRNDVTGQMLLRDGSVAALSTLTLPARFTLTATLQRPDIPGTITFSGRTQLQMTIDPNGRSLALGARSVYYPRQWLPYLAEVGWDLTRSALWGFALLGAIVLVAAVALPAIRRLSPATLGAVAARYTPLARAAPGTALVLAVVILVELLCISDVTYQQLPRVYDAISYYFQAAIFHSGRLYEPIPAAVGYFPGPFMVIADGHWFSNFPLGAPLAIAAGMAVGAPWIVEPILGALSVVLLADLARRWYGISTLAVTLLLLALSPFFLFLAASYMSHTVALFALLLFLQGMDRWSYSGRARWAVMAAAGAGYGFLTREIAVVFFGAPVLFSYALTCAPDLWRRLRTERFARLTAANLAGWFLLPLVASAAIYVCYNWILTGDPLLTPRAALDPRNTWGFGVGKGWWNLHTFAAGLYLVELQITSLLTDLFGWPYYLTLSFFFLPLLTLHLRAHDLMLYGIAGLFLLGYTGYFYHGIAYGPRFLYESLPAYILLTARGVVVAAEVSSALLRRGEVQYAPRLAGACGAVLTLVALCACNLIFYLPRQFPLYFDYLEHRAAGGLAYARVHPPWLHRAIVLTGDYSFYGDVMFPLNDPALTGDVLYAFVGGDRNLAGLLAAYPGRSLYWLSTANDRVTFRPMPVGNAPSRARSLPTLSTGTYSSMTLSAAGDLYVANSADGSIRRLSPSGSVRSFLQTSVPPGTAFTLHVSGNDLYWLNPATDVFWRAPLIGGKAVALFRCRCASTSAFAIAPDGTVITADPASGLQRYGTAGRLLASAFNPGALSAVAVTADGTVFAYDQGAQQLVAYDASLNGRRVLDTGGQAGWPVQLTAFGEWVVLEDNVHEQLVAYNNRTSAVRALSVTSDGTMIPMQSWGLAWNGHMLAFGSASTSSLEEFSTNDTPF